MGQHKTNPTAQAARSGELKPKPRVNVAVAAISKLAALFFPFRDRLYVAPALGNRVARKARERPRAHRRAESDLVAKLSSHRSHLYPPKQGSRRPEFSSAVPGEWSTKPAA